MAAQPWSMWIDRLTRRARGKQGISQRKLRQSIRPRLVLESLEDRIAPASDITIITSGVGSLDSVLAANNGAITVNDGANGGTQAETLSVAALLAVPAADNISIAARNSITFDDLTPLGGTLALTKNNQNVSFSTTTGAIAFVNTANSLTAHANLQFTAGTNLTLGDLTSEVINLTTGPGGAYISGTGGKLALHGDDNVTISADNIVLNTGVSCSSGNVVLQQAMGGGGLFSETRSIDVGGGTTPGDLDITDAELGLIKTSDAVVIGRADNAGNITVTDNAAGTGGITAHNGIPAVELLSGGSITAADAKATIAVGGFGSLELTASTGIGTQKSPLKTQVSFLSAETTTGGVFVTNGSAAATALTLQGPGVQVTGASGDIQLINNGTININNSGGQGSLIQGPANVTVQANGATSDVVVSGQSAFGGITSIGNGVVTVQAGQDISLGSSGNSFGDVVSKNGSIVLDAGGNLTLNSNGSVVVEDGAGAITATAGGNITMIPTPTGFFGPTFETQGGAVSLTTGARGTFSADALNEDNAVISKGGAITVSADNIVLTKGLNAGTGIVTLQEATGGTGSTPRNIDIGGGTTAGDLDITDADLNEIIAGVLRIGRLDNTGNITVTDNAAGNGGITTHTGFDTLDLLSGGNINSADGKASIAVTNLAVQAVGNAGTANNQLAGQVTTLAANVTGQGHSLYFFNAVSTRLGGLNLSIGLVDGINGITSNDGSVQLITQGTLTVDSNIHSQGGNIGLGGEAFVNSGTTTFGAAINSGGGQVGVFADNLDLQPDSSINAGAGRVSLIENIANALINVGSPGTQSPLSLGVTAAAINTITAGTLQIGDNRAADLTITDASAPAHVSTLDLQTGGAIIEGTNGSLSVANLALQAVSGIGDGGAIQLVGPTNLAFANSMTGNVMISDNGALTIAAVDSLNNTNGNNVGNFASGGAIDLTANEGSLTFAISTSSDSITQATTTGTAAAQNNITVKSGVTVAAVETNDVFFSSADNILLQTGSIVQSKTGNVGLVVGANDSNTVSATLQGTIEGASPTVQAGDGKASVLVDFANGATMPNGLTFTGRSSNNTLNVSDANDNTAHIYTITGSNVVRDGATINFTKVANVTVSGGNQADSFNVTPSAATTFTVNGGNPTPPALPGDTLNVSLAGLSAPQLTQSFNPASGFAGAWTFGNVDPVNFTGMETLLPAVAQLAVTLDATPNPALPDSNLTYTVTVTNNGSSAAQNVVLSDTLPSGETFVSQAQNSGPALTLSNVGNAISDTIAFLSSGASASFTIVAHLASDLTNNTILTNTATASTTTMQTSTAGNSATLTTTVNAQADLTLTASGPNANLFGNTLSYTYTLVNNGPSNAANVVLSASLPAGVNVVSASQVSGNDPFAGAIAGSTVTFTALVVAAGDSAVFQAIVSVAGGAGRASSLRSTATVASDTSDPNMGNDAASTPKSLLTVLSNQLQVNQLALGQLRTAGGEMTALQQFLFWFGNANTLSSGDAIPLIVEELLLTLAETAMASGLPLQGFVNAQQAAIVANPLYGTLSGYELGLWSGALTSILF